MWQIAGMKDVDENTPGARLRAARQARGWTQVEMAVEADCARAYVSQLETGKEEGGRDVWQKCANALGVTLDYFFGPGGTPSEPVTSYHISEPNEVALIRFWKELNRREKAIAWKLLLTLKSPDE